MRFGCNVRDPQQAEVVIQAGLDYIEMNLCRLMQLPEEEYEIFARRIEEAPIKIEIFNLLLPLDGSIPIVGDKANEAQQRTWFQEAFPKAVRLGCRLMVFGSARARAVPPGFPPERARKQLVDFLKLLMEFAQQYGITVVIEPVCSLEVETDTIKTVPDAVELAKEVGHPMLFALCDNYHMFYEREPMSNIVEAGKWIRHAHISGVDAGRSYPKLDDGHDYGPYLDALCQIGYDDTLSLECFDMNIAAGLPESMKLLKNYYLHTQI